MDQRLFRTAGYSFELVIGQGCLIISAHKDSSLGARFKVLELGQRISFSGVSESSHGISAARLRLLANQARSNRGRARMSSEAT